MFPLWADPLRIRIFCDKYLNIAPEIAVFRPALPFVFLQFITYGRMEAAARAYGWVAQNEVLFNIPLEWHRKVDGKWVYQGLATVSPFIFVDSDQSFLGGRETLGWPKVKARLTPAIDPWTKDPFGEDSLLAMSTPVFSRVYAGRGQEEKRFLEILRAPAPGLLDLPARALRGGLETMSIGSRFVRDYWQTRGASPLAAKPGEDGTNGGLLSLLQYWMRAGRSFTTVNLKQLRCSGDPDRAIWQGLTVARMKTIRTPRIRPLEVARVWSGDPSGGFRIRITDFQSQPIVEALGLRLTEGKKSGGTWSGSLVPVYPYWMSVDLRYEGGENLFSFSPWSGEFEPGNSRDWSGMDTVPEPRERRALPLPDYNLARGVSIAEIPGPVTFAESTLFVLPLLARTQKLRDLCSELTAALATSIDDGADPVVIEPLDSSTNSYVYMVVTRARAMASPQNDIGRWLEKEVAFHVPVKVSVGDELVMVAMITPFVFLDSGIAILSVKENNGWTADLARIHIESLRDSLRQKIDPETPLDLLRLEVEMVPAIGLNLEFETGNLLEVRRGGPPKKEEESESSTPWKKAVLGDYIHACSRFYESTEPKTEVANPTHLVPFFVHDHLPINVLGLRQLRDLRNPELASFQALTLTRLGIRGLRDVNIIDEPIRVRIRTVPSFPIVERLGLIEESTRLEAAELPMKILAPIRPFLVEADWRMDEAEDLLWWNGRWNRQGLDALCRRQRQLRGSRSGVGSRYYSRLERRFTECGGKGKVPGEGSLVQTIVEMALHRLAQDGGCTDPGPFDRLSGVLAPKTIPDIFVRRLADLPDGYQQDHRGKEQISFSDWMWSTILDRIAKVVATGSTVLQAEVDSGASAANDPITYLRSGLGSSKQPSPPPARRGGSELGAEASPKVAGGAGSESETDVMSETYIAEGRNASRAEKRRRFSEVRERLVDLGKPRVATEVLHTWYSEVDALWNAYIEEAETPPPQEPKKASGEKPSQAS